MSASHTVGRFELKLGWIGLLCKRFVSVQTGLKKRATTIEVKRKPPQTAAVDLLLNKSHATANISLLACLQKLYTAALKRTRENLEVDAVMEGSMLPPHFDNVHYIILTN